MEGQYRFDFENDSSAVDECLGSAWIQVPEHRWCCDTIHPIEGLSSLHHSYDNPEDGCDYLVLKHDLIKPEEPFSFSFRIRHAYAPSSQNNWQLALGATLSDGPEPAILSGLVFGVNFKGSDDLIKIWSVKQGETELSLSTTLNYQEQVGTDQAPLFLLSGDGDGSLDLYWSPDPAEVLAVWLGSCRIDEQNWGRQLILQYKYSSSRDRALFLDRLVLEGIFVKDTIAPELSGVSFVDKNNLQLVFSERVIISEASSFVLYSEEHPGGVIPDSVMEIDQGLILAYPEVIPNRVAHQLSLKGIVDLDGNLLQDTMVSVLRNEALWGDLVFNEVMADPDPALRYEGEYLELIHRSDYDVNLEGWFLQVNERSYLLDALNVEPVSMELQPGQFLLLSGIALPNEGALLSLYNKEGTLVHAASYKIPWDGSNWKKEGGWSLESPDSDQLCRISVNWEYTKDPEGGTPGRINSNYALRVDEESPVLLYAGVGDAGLDGAGELFLHYSEPLALSQDLRAAIRLDPGDAEPDTVLFVDPLREILQVRFSHGFQLWPNYRLSVSGLSDCMANVSDDYVFKAGAVSQPELASLLINEIMYDPEEGMPEYVELFLPGDQILDLKDLAIHVKEEGGSADHPIALSPHSRLIRPGQYLVLTDCVPHLMDAYGLEVSGQWVEVEGLPGLNNSSGIIYLTDRAANVVDLAEYSDEMHMELLDDPRGISLERISASRSGNDPDNWHSAASIVGYASPGMENSQSYGGSDSDLLLDISTEVFSPDNDANMDLLEIFIRTNGNDWVISLVITDLHGKIIRVLANNHLAGPSVTYTWDGEGDLGAMQPMGFYVIHARGYRPHTGEQWIRRRAVGLVYR